MASAEAHFGVEERNPRVARILEILSKKEAGEITTKEHRECLVLNDELLAAYGGGARSFGATDLAHFDDGRALTQIGFLAIWHLRRNSKPVFPREPKKWLARARNAFDVTRGADGSGN